jgi:hypothetical protein
MKSIGPNQKRKMLTTKLLTNRLKKRKRNEIPPTKRSKKL